MKVAATLGHQHATAGSCPSFRTPQREKGLAVCEAVADEIGYPRDHVTPASRLAPDLGLDEFDVAELAAALEVRFSLRISERAMRSFRTVADIERSLGRERDAVPPAIR